MRLIRVRAFDVATFVAHGAAQAGIVGSDVVEEFGYPDLYARWTLPSAIAAFRWQSR
jgi:ATP phosphoribosyltransferase